MSYEKLKKGVVKRTEQRVLGIFIDGIGLDRASKRMQRKIDLASLIKGVSSGLKPVVARYYTVIPHEDDARQFSFLEAVTRSGLSVIVKRLPPKGMTRQVTTDVEMGSDIIAFAQGHTNFGDLSRYIPEELREAPRREGPYGRQVSMTKLSAAKASGEDEAQIEDLGKSPIKRIVTVICPSHEIAYSLSLATEIGADTVTADFSDRRTRDVLKSSAKWIDLSTSETIWRD